MKLKESNIYYVKLDDIFGKRTQENLFNNYTGINGNNSLNDLRLSIDPYGLVQFDVTLTDGNIIKTPARTRLTAYKNIEEIIHAICTELNLTNWDKLLNKLQSTPLHKMNTKDWSPTI